MDEEQRLGELLGLKQKQPNTWALEQVKEEFLRRHFRVETPIQSQAIEPIYRGANAVLISATASGKTEAAMIPIAANLLAHQKQSLAIYLACFRHFTITNIP